MLVTWQARMVKMNGNIPSYWRTTKVLYYPTLSYHIHIIHISSTNTSRFHKIHLIIDESKVIRNIPLAKSPHGAFSQKIRNLTGKWRCPRKVRILSEFPCCVKFGVRFQLDRKFWWIISTFLIGSSDLLEMSFLFCALNLHCFIEIENN